MFPSKGQTLSRLVLLVAAVAVPILSTSASGDPNACAEIATAYADWVANEGECLLARNKKDSRI